MDTYEYDPVNNIIEMKHARGGTVEWRRRRFASASFAAVRARRFAEAVLAWVERGEAPEVGLPPEPLPEAGPGPFDELRPYPWPVARREERDGWLVDGERGTAVCQSAPAA